MTPTIIEKDAEFFMSCGASGGSKIITGVLQTILQTIAFGRNLLDAVSLPRMHDQLLPAEMNLEHDFPNQPFVPDFVRMVGIFFFFLCFCLLILKLKGHNVTVRPPTWSDAVVQAVKREEDGQLSAACDWRKAGVRTELCIPAGY